MASVRYCSHTNSTLFTTCCGIAICDDQSKCPGCGEEVPHNPRERHDIAMRSLYGADAVRKMREEWNRKSLGDK